MEERDVKDKIADVIQETKLPYEMKYRKGRGGPFEVFNLQTKEVEESYRFREPCKSRVNDKNAVFLANVIFHEIKDLL